VKEFNKLMLRIQLLKEFKHCTCEDSKEEEKIFFKRSFYYIFICFFFFKSSFIILFFQHATNLTDNNGANFSFSHTHAGTRTDVGTRA